KLLCRLALRLSKHFRAAHDPVRLIGLREPREDVIHRVLDAGRGAMELTGRLRDQLAQHVTVLHRIQGAENQIRTHWDKPAFFTVMKSNYCGPNDTSPIT